ncbi:FkbM family methyltransferase [Roseivirga misakiensis]|uniref:FkbM family methyltransferase n=1 Tax=Roseivirga misakiensis TaxID=1563681 RepID=UPI00114D143D|nr:FkbM family methyltransferase [Roseivirga misakiensis]
MRDFVKKWSRKLGFEIVRYPNDHLLRRVKLYNHFMVDCLIDIGANQGQFASLSRKLGFNGRIISFEPTSFAYQRLKANSQNDPSWECLNLGVGDKNEKAFINVSQNSVSSSLLDLEDSHKEAAPASTFESREEIEVKTIDSLFPELGLQQHRSIMLKLDVQGFEMMVLKGAENSLKDIVGIQLEMSLTELYKGESLFDDMNAYIVSKGFDLYSLEPGFYDPESGRLLQVDGVYFKNR